MEKYKKTIISRIRILYFLLISVVTFMLFNVFGTTTETREGHIWAYQCGILVELGFIVLAYLIRYKKALSDERKLAIQYNKENDERMKAIRTKAGMPMLLFTSIAMIIIGMIFGYFNVTVFYVLTITASCQLVVGCIVKLIYMKKM